MKQESQEKEDALKNHLSNIIKKHDKLLTEVKTAMESVSECKKENCKLKKELAAKKFMFQTQQALWECYLKLCLSV